ncbi:MAG: hypothetical protein WAZ19_09340 [Anaerolineae bacterium]
MPAHLTQALLIILGVAVVTFVLYLYVLPNSEIDATELRIADLKTQHAALARENAALQQEIALASQLDKLEDRAFALGMQYTRNKPIYLQMPVAENEQTPAEVLSARTEAQATNATTWRQWFERENLQTMWRNMRIKVSSVVDAVIERLQAFGNSLVNQRVMP